MKTLGTILVAATFSLFVACNMDNADNPSNSAPSSDTTVVTTLDMTTGGEPVTHQPLDSILTDTANKDTISR